MCLSIAYTDQELIININNLLGKQLNIYILLI